jgi:hypothetical protein
LHYGRAPDLTGLGAFFFGLENSPLGHLAGRGTERCYGAGDKDMATSSLHAI